MNRTLSYIPILPRPIFFFQNYYFYFILIKNKWNLCKLQDDFILSINERQVLFCFLGIGSGVDTHNGSLLPTLTLIQLFINLSLCELSYMVYILLLALLFVIYTSHKFRVPTPPTTPKNCLS